MIIHRIIIVLFIVVIVQIIIRHRQHYVVNQVLLDHVHVIYEMIIIIYLNFNQC
jgi:hypothetical protein